MLAFCLVALACLVLVCGAFVEQMEEQQQQELNTSFPNYLPELR